MNAISPLISASWLFKNAAQSELIILDASLKNPIKEGQTLSNKIIPNALKFDWDSFSDITNPLPHTMPNADQFTQSAQQLGINKNSLIVIYDASGIYSSPRVWWMFVAMGFKNCFILDGGLPEWLRLGYPYANGYADAKGNGDFSATFNANLISSKQEVFKAMNKKDKVIIDARSEARFYGKVSEPRAGLRVGHIPSSMNIPFETLLSEEKMRTAAELEEIFSFVENKDTPLIFSCGSGVTACIDALAASIIGFKNISIYDGSWSEWGADSEHPVAQNAE